MPAGLKALPLEGFSHSFFFSLPHGEHLFRKVALCPLWANIDRDGVEADADGAAQVLKLPLSAPQTCLFPSLSPGAGGSIPVCFVTTLVEGFIK